MTNPLAKLLPCAFLGLVLTLAAGCSVGIATDPNGYPFPSEGVFQVAAGAKVDVVNGWPNPAQFPLENHAYCDAQQFTETAASIVKRELAKKGVVIAPGSDKKLTLRILSPSLGQGFGMQRGLVSLEAQFGPTTISVEGEARSGGGPNRVFNAAIVRAVSELLKKPELAAWLSSH